MNVALPPDLERFVKEKVAEGAYPTEGAVVTEALRRLAAWEARERERIEALRREIAVGDEQLARGEGREFDVEAIKRRGREALAKRADLPKSA